MPKYYLLLIETFGNQSYIYATNKLRECIGASEIIYQCGTDWVLDSIHSVLLDIDNSINFKKQFHAEESDGSNEQSPFDKRQHLLESPLLPNQQMPVSLVLLTSGKALLLCLEHDIAKKIAQCHALRVLKEAPGLEVGSAIETIQDTEQNKAFSKAYMAVKERLDQHRQRMPSSKQRFPMLPMLEPCTVSGLPASRDLTKSSNVWGSQVSYQKRQFEKNWVKRVQSLLERYNKKSRQRTLEKKNIEVEAKINQLEQGFENIDWLAIVHADGNGLGKIFLEFDKYSAKLEKKSKESSSFENQIEILRRFSSQLDTVTENAFYKACSYLRDYAIQKNLPWIKYNQGEYFDDIHLPIFPLLLGGDDLTVVMDGRYALPFTEYFLKAFEEEIQQEGSEDTTIVGEIAQQAFEVRRLGICAGVALIKPHFPFFQGYQLAEQLIQSAKTVKKYVKAPSSNEPYPCSALDFHVLFDTHFSSLDSIRKTFSEHKKEKSETVFEVFGGPYVVSNRQAFDEKMAKGSVLEWLQQHDGEKLKSKVKALNATGDDDKRRLPNSQMHRLREALYWGPNYCDERLAEILSIYDPDRINPLLQNTGADKPSLFSRKINHNNQQQDKTVFHTQFLDALTSASFWLEDSSEQESSQ